MLNPWEAREARDQLIEEVFEEVRHRGWTGGMLGNTVVVEGIQVALSDFQANAQRTFDHLEALLRSDQQLKLAEVQRQVEAWQWGRHQ